MNIANDTPALVSNWKKKYKCTETSGTRWTLKTTAQCKSAQETQDYPRRNGPQAHLVVAFVVVVDDDDGDDDGGGNGNLAP
jgi:hypothetical protein